ncbi:MAG: hypothetical protein U0V74_17300 [Chitinophagales bacterium]
MKKPFRTLAILCLCILSATLFAQSGNYQKIADDYKQKIEATQDPNEKLRLALELQKLMLGESVVNGSLSPMQAATMYDKKYLVKFQASSDESSAQNCITCGPCGAFFDSKSHYDITASFVVVMHRPYGTFSAAATTQDNVEQLSAGGSYNYSSKSTGCGKPENDNSTGHLDLTKNNRGIEFGFTYNTNDNTWDINLQLPYVIHTNAQGGENDDVELFGSSVNSRQEGASASEKNGKITIAANYTVSDNDAKTGRTNKSTTTINCTLTPYDETKYDALIVPYRASQDKNDAEYENWLPVGRKKDADRANSAVYGNAIAFKIKLIEKDNPAKDISGTLYQVDWKLEASKLKGDCTNFPIESSDEKEDLRFDVKAAPLSAEVSDFKELRSAPQQGAACPARILCYDNGAYGKLTAHVKITTPNGPVEIDAHLDGDTKTEVSIPKDENDNKMADKWEKDEGIFEKNYGPIKDDEQQPDNKNDGDGLSLFEEYRGIMSNDELKRLNPKNKDLIVHNASKQIKDADLAKFTDYTGKYGEGGIKLIFVKDDEVKKEKMWVNNNKTVFSNGEQHGIYIKDIPLDVTMEGVAKAVARGGDDAKLASPKDLNYICIQQGFRLSDQPYIKNVALFKTNTVCHEIAHACGVTHHNGDVAAKYEPLSSSGLNVSKAIFYDVVAKKVVKYSDMPGASTYNCIITSDYKESEASGDANCLMTYNSVIPLSAYRDFFMYKYGINKDLILFKFPSDEFRDGFCRNKENTLWNIAANNKITFTEVVDGKEKVISEEVSMYGKPIKGGNCISQFKVKDW